MKYFNSISKNFDLPRVPENANGEVILGSFYRFLGLAKATEKEVGPNSREFKSKVDEGIRFASACKLPSGMDNESFKVLVQQVLESPKLKNQNLKGSYFIYPLIPAFAEIGSVARYRGNPWNPGQYLGEMVAKGLNQDEKRRNLLQSCFDHLAVYETPGGNMNGDVPSDDLWSMFCKEEFKCILNGKDTSFEMPKLDSSYINLSNSPSHRFVKDLEVILRLKNMMTRHKWISLVESYLRLAIMVDVLWHCRLTSQIIDIVEKNDKEPVTAELVDRRLSRFKYFDIGGKNKVFFKETLRRYFRSSLILQELVQVHSKEKGYSFPANICKKEITVWTKDLLSIRGFRPIYRDIVTRVDRQIDQGEDMRKEMDCKKGRTKNIMEALTYIPSKRNVLESEKLAHDQGFWINNKRGWIFEPGPVALTVLIQLCCDELESEVISARDFIDFIMGYGIETTNKELSKGFIGQQLRKLGYVIDSPDFEGGILISIPYNTYSI